MQERAEKAEDRARVELAAAKSAQQQAETRMNDLNTQLQLSLVAVSAARYSSVLALLVLKYKY